MTNKLNFKSGLEQTGVVDNTSAMLETLGKQAGKAMGPELAKGNIPGAMYLAKTAADTANAAREMSGYSNTPKPSNTNDAPAVKGPRAK